MTYRLLLFAHILAAAAWAGGGLVLWAVGVRVLRSNDRSRIGWLVHEAEWVGIRVFTPAAFFVLITGIALVLAGKWGFHHMWIIYGLVVYALNAAVGAAFIRWEPARIVSMIDSFGIGEASVQRRIRRLLWVVRIDLLLLVSVLFDMSFKPGS